MIFDGLIRFLFLLSRSLLVIGGGLMLSAFPLNGKNISATIEQESLIIDSLILNNRLAEAEKILGHLEGELPYYKNNEGHSQLQATLMLYEVDLCLRKEQFSKAAEIAFLVLDLAKKHNLPIIEYKTSLIVALTYEQTGYFGLCREYLDRAYRIYEEHKLVDVFSTYCIRVSSYYRLTGRGEEARTFAYYGLEYGQKYGQTRDFYDACLLLGILLKAAEYEQSIYYTSLAARSFMKRNDYSGVAAMYNNISKTLFLHKQTSRALLHNDSALYIQKAYPLLIEKSLSSIIFKHRSELFEAEGKLDSAFYYFRQYHTDTILANTKIEAAEIKGITEKYESQKKENTIQKQRQQLIFTIVLLLVITIASVLVIQRNIKINSQNKLINSQLDEMAKALQQKQVLLSELQHRVKNNMQHIISILEMQKESINHNNIEELIRSNQSRIYSMSLLHKKLHISDNVNEVDLKRYLEELSELVKSSYNTEKEIIITNICEIDNLTIDKASPIGLIIVELISNSIKHAFEHVSNGIITINITKDIISQTHKLHYADNGSGFDFHKTPEKGLGIEIIKGLSDQLSGTLIASNQAGFNLILYF